MNKALTHKGFDPAIIRMMTSSVSRAIRANMLIKSTKYTVRVYQPKARHLFVQC